MSLDITVIKRDGREEDFSENKIAMSIFSAANEAGGDDFELAEELTEQLIEIIDSGDFDDEISTSTLQEMIEKLLIETGHAKTAKAYILSAADRARIREMDSSLMKSFEDITFTSPEESDMKRENANIDSSTAMGTMLKYGSEGAKTFNLLHLISKDIADAHASGDIHIHDLDFYSLTETCIAKDTLLSVKINGVEMTVTAEQLSDYFNLDTVDEWKKAKNVQILSNGKYVGVKAMVKHTSADKHMMNIVTPTGELHVTDDHKISIIKDNKIVDEKVSDVHTGDVLSIPNIDIDRYNLDKIDIIELYKGDNFVIANTEEVLENIKRSGNWKAFCKGFNYENGRNRSLRTGRTKLTIQEYKSIENLCTMSHSDLKIRYKRSRGEETINAVVPLTFELGNIIGLMYTEGSITEHISSQQKSPVKKACFCNYNEDLIQQFNKNYSTVFNNPYINARKHNGRHTGSVLSGYLQYELFHGIFGTKYSTDDIRLAQWMFSANKDFVNGLIAGIIDGDGTVQKDGYRVIISSVSKEFLKDIQKLLLLRGITSSIKLENTTQAGTKASFVKDNGDVVESIRNYNNYKLELTGNLYNKLAWVNSNKLNEIELRSSDRKPNNQPTITEIKEIEYTDFVYDIETDDNHFTADGFNVHNCCQIPLDKLFKGGFNTGHGFLREPGSIRTAGALAAIAIQSNQNDQHGGQSIPLFDYYLAPYVALTFIKNLATIATIKFDIDDKEYKGLKRKLVDYQKEHKLVMNDRCLGELRAIVSDYLDSIDIEYTDKELDKLFERADKTTYDDTYQAMEAFVHNLNSMHSRAGSQVPFSSVNFGTDISTEGRYVSKTLLETTDRGLGNGEIAIFPISIFKMKKGVNFDPGDPNYDLFKLSCKVSSHRLYPNFCNLDAPFNAEIYDGTPETEMATMGCVESSEILHYKINNIDFIETFGDAYNRVSNIGNVVNYSENSEYIDTSGIDIKVKDSVNGFVKVKKFIKNRNVDNFNVVRLSDGYSITATSDHPLPVVDKGRTFVSELKTGDKINVSTCDAINTDNKFSTDYFGDDTYLLGVLLADSAYSSSQINISLGFDEIDVVEHIYNAVEKLGYTLNIVEQHRGDKGDYVDCHIKDIRPLKNAREELADLFGGYSKADRRIPSSMLTASRGLRINLLAGLLDADGHVTHSRHRDGKTPRSARFSIGSTNKALAMTELALIRGLGYKAKMYRNKYSSRHSKIRFLIEFEIADEVINAMHCNKKIDIAKNVSRCTFNAISTVTVDKIVPGCEENETDGISYDLETESDMLDISYINSHNCRTRVGTNKYNPANTVIPGRGNLSFTSINLPRIAIQANHDINKFYEILDKRLELVHRQLLERFDVQCLKKPINYPFLMGQGIWIDSDRLRPADDIREVLRNGTFGVGFIGLAETLTALIGKHHGESEEAQKLGLEIINHMKEYCDAWSEYEHMNYGVIGTPAEGLSGRFVRIDKKLFGIIPGVTDKEYYTNSSHVPVSFKISATDKVDIEAPYHALELGGHICYIEMDGDPTKNLKAFMKIVRYMHDKGVGYCAINHPVDRDPVCGYTGIIGDVCPRCGRRENEPMTMEMYERIKGYANVGNADTLGVHGNPDEEADRLTNN